MNKTSYDLANRLFSMVILQVHVALLWGAVGRRYRGYGVGGSVAAAVLAVAVSQILIFAGTAISYVAGINALFNFPEALNQQATVIQHPEEQVVILVNSTVLRKAERLLDSCEHCNSEGVEIPFENVLDRVTPPISARQITFSRRPQSVHTRTTN